MKLLITISLFVLSYALHAQQGLQMVIPEVDSGAIENEKQILLNRLLTGQAPPALFVEDLALQEFNFNEAFANRYQLNKAIYPQNNYVNIDYFPGMNFSFNAPVHLYGTVFSSDARKLGDNFVVGGFSYGANSPFGAPLPRNAANNYNFRGNTMFLQYKVSKNFKIETRVNVNHGPGPGF